MTVGRRVALGAAGALAGLVATLAMVLAMLLLRRWAGVAPPFEAIPDRLAPTLDVDRFIELVNEYGYNRLKRFGIQAGLTGLLVVGTLVGVAYALVTESARSRAGAWTGGLSRLGLMFVGGAFAALWLGSMVVLWPVLDTNHRGLPPSTARWVTAGAYLALYALYGVLLVLGYAALTRRGAGLPAVDTAADPAQAPTPDPAAARAARASGVRPAGTPVARRAVVLAAVAALLWWPSVRLLRWFERRATFAYDGRRYSGAGIEPITPNASFYSVTKNVVDPDVDRDWWRLEVTGEVPDPRTYAFEDLGAFEEIQQESTLMCISNHVSAGLMSNTVWTGVRMRDLLAASGVDPDNVRSDQVEVALHAADGYTDTFSMAEALDPTTLVAYRMGGEPLPRIHGYPVRVIVPGLFGEKNVKWVTGIEVVDHDVQGFYEQQGWGPNFAVPTRSDFFAPQLAGGNGRFRDPFAYGEPVRLRGRAFAGDRGISKVEISFDGGESWRDVDRFDYQKPLTWVFWSHVWTPGIRGERLLAVRAYDGTGTLQPLERLPSYPREGVTGTHRVRAVVE